MSIYTDLIEAGLDVSNWQSDLYVPVCDNSREILKKYPKQTRSTFKSNVDGLQMYELPFAFDPFWKKRS